MDKKKRFNKILEDIKNVKIQGATNIAKVALYAYSLNPATYAKQKLIKARPTEPLLVNVLDKADRLGKKEILNHFKNTQEKINRLTLKIIKNNYVIFTHCHSTSVINALVYAKKHKRKFEVYNTETRPLYQGRKTASELRKAGIKVTMFTDSAIAIALEKKHNTKKVNLIFLGADAILKNSVINKIGSGLIAELAYKHKIPLYILADSWKFTKKVKIEERDFHEVWKNAPKNIKIRNPAFEKIDRKYIKAVVSEFGILSFDKFLKRV